MIHILCTTYSYYCTCNIHFVYTSRGRAILRIPRRIIHIFVARPRPLLSRFIPVYPLRDSRRIYVALRLYQSVRRSAFALNQISLLSVETPHYLSSRRASRLDRIPAPRPCSLALFFIFLSVFIAGPAASLPRSKSARLCCSLLANTTRSAVVYSHCVDFSPRL